jgi:DNA-directed RNA polymerase I, II, and III subunit RPABC1
MENKYLKDIFRSRKTMVEILTLRGYKMENTVCEMDFETFAEMSNFDIVDDDSKIYVYYSLDNVKLSNDTINTITSGIIEKYDDDMKIIIIYTNIVGNILNKKLYNIQLFNLCEVIINKTKHKYALKHVIIDKNEIEILLKKYEITEDQLPKILHNDPMIKIIGAEIGDVIKIERTSESTGKYYYYRICV